MHLNYTLKLLLSKQCLHLNQYLSTFKNTCTFSDQTEFSDRSCASLQQAGVLYKIPCSGCPRLMNISEMLSKSYSTITCPVKTTSLDGQLWVTTLHKTVPSSSSLLVSKRKSSQGLIETTQRFHTHMYSLSWHIRKEECVLNREKGLLSEVYLTLQSSHKLNIQQSACDQDQHMWPL